MIRPPKSDAEVRIWRRLITDELNEPSQKSKHYSFSGIDPLGPATAPTASEDGWLFAHNFDNVAGMIIQIDKDLTGWVDLNPNIHWQKTTDETGDVEWELEYDMASNGEDFSGTYTSTGTFYTVNEGTVDNNTSTRLLVTHLGTVDMSNLVGTEAIIKVRVYRLGSTGANDTYGADALALTLTL